MSLDIGEEAITSAVLSEHAAISIAFVVDRVLEARLLDGGPNDLSGGSYGPIRSATRRFQSLPPALPVSQLPPPRAGRAAAPGAPLPPHSGDAADRTATATM